MDILLTEETVLLESKLETPENFFLENKEYTLTTWSSESVSTSGQQGILQHFTINDQATKTKLLIEVGPDQF